MGLEGRPFHLLSGGRDEPGMNTAARKLAWTRDERVAVRAHLLLTLVIARADSVWRKDRDGSSVDFVPTHLFRVMPSKPGA
jgi:hypothetical protein